MRVCKCVCVNRCSPHLASTSLLSVSLTAGDVNVGCTRKLWSLVSWLNLQHTHRHKTHTFYKHVSVLESCGHSFHGWTCKTHTHTHAHTHADTTHTNFVNMWKYQNAMITRFMVKPAKHTQHTHTLTQRHTHTHIDTHIDTHTHTHAHTHTNALWPWQYFSAQGRPRAHSK
jgi:hypothetical protein